MSLDTTDRGQSLMSMDTQRSESYATGHTEVRALYHWTHRGQNLLSLDTPTGVRVLYQWTHRGQNLMTLDTPTGVRVYVTRHIDRRQSLMSLDTQRS